MPRFHVSAYGASLAAGPNLDTAAAQDDVLVTRNSHLIFTSPYWLLGAAPIGALINRSRFGNAALQRYSFVHLHPLIVSATVPTIPQFMDLRANPIRLPMNEELTVESGNSGAGPTITSAILMLGAQGWSRNLPSYIDRIVVRATAVVAAGTTTTWGALANLVFERDLLNGTYSVLGATVVAAGALAFRMRFIDQPAIDGKQHRPGGLVQQSHTTQPNEVWSGGWGEWGRFHTFSPPQIQTYGDAAGGTYEVRLDLAYLGESRDLVYGF